MTVLSLLFIACGKDNYDEPTSTISGTVSYKGKPIGVRGTGEVVKLQLYQEGFQLKAPVQVYVGQDGSFKVKIFDGVIRDNFIIYFDISLQFKLYGIGVV